MLIAVFITEMVILHKYVFIIIIIIKRFSEHSASSLPSVLQYEETIFPRDESELWPITPRGLWQKLKGVNLD